MAAELSREREKPAIRALRAEDAPAVAGILLESPEAVFWPETSVKDVLRLRGTLALVSESDGRVTGFLIGRQTGEDAEILNLAVARPNRRLGEGGALLTAAAAAFRARGVSRVFLEVRESNHNAIGFYREHGFFATGRRGGYYRDPAESAVVMEKTLTGEK